MKILCVIDSLCSGGAQRQLVELALGFSDKGHHVSFMTYHKIAFFQPALDQKGIQITCIEEPVYLKRLLKIRRYIRQGNFDSILSFLESPNIICELAGFPFKSWKLIVGERSANPGITGSLKKRALRFFHFFADFVVANSQTNISLVRKANPFLNKRKLKVIYNTLDFKRNKPSTNYTPRVDGTTHIVIAGRQAHPKNLTGLIAALRLMDHNKRKHLKISWYGDREKHPSRNDPFEMALQKIEENVPDGIITFYPSCVDIEAKMQNADAVGLFSIYEGFPNSICEAMACAKPVVCSAVSDIPLFVDEPSLLCDPNDPESIKNALLALIQLKNDELVQIGERNYQKAVGLFNREQIISEYLQLLNPS